MNTRLLGKHAHSYPPWKLNFTCKKGIWSASIAFTLYMSVNTDRSLAQSAIETQVGPLVGTIEAYFEPILNEGKLKGCTMVFSSIARDTKYELDSYLRIDGNFGIMASGDSLGSNLKVVVNRIQSDGGSINFAPIRPSRAYMMSKDLSTSVDATIKTFEGDTPGSLFVVFEASRGIQFATEIVRDEKISIAFNQGSGSSDLLVPIDFGVVSVDGSGNRRRSRTTIETFSNCLGEVAKLLQ